MSNIVYGNLSPAEHMQVIPTDSPYAVARDIAALLGLNRKGLSDDNTILTAVSNAHEAFVQVMPPEGETFTPGQRRILAAIRAYRDRHLTLSGEQANSTIRLDWFSFPDLNTTTTVHQVEEVGSLSGTGVARMGLDQVVYAPSQAEALRHVAKQTTDDPNRAAAIIGLTAASFEDSLKALEVASIQPTALDAARVALNSLTALAQLA